MESSEEALAYYKEQLAAKTQMLDMTTQFLEAARIALEEKNRALALAHNSIMEGVSFAQIIQRALLPDIGLLDGICKDASYSVKQQIGIGGDSVFIKKSDSRVIFGLLDSTGHGIPGAMLSVAGNLSLNEMMFIADDPNPSDFSTFLSNRLHSAFNNSGQALAHMEGIILSPTAKKNTFRYVSARGKSMIIGQNGIRELHSAKSALGDNETVFTDSEVIFSEGETLLLFSDGLIDQFGGVRDRKYTKARLREYLMAKHTLPAQALKDALLEEHEKWKGTAEQTDDISLMILKF